jgi:hypothetical protein
MAPTRHSWRPPAIHGTTVGATFMAPTRHSWRPPAIHGAHPRPTRMALGAHPAKMRPQLDAITSNWGQLIAPGCHPIAPVQGLIVQETVKGSRWASRGRVPGCQCVIGKG